MSVVFTIDQPKSSVRLILACPKTSPMTWEEANTYAHSLGKGWRLPTSKELLCIMNNFKLGDSVLQEYWTGEANSAEEVDVGYVYLNKSYMGSQPKNNRYHVVSVKTLKEDQN